MITKVAAALALTLSIINTLMLLELRQEVSLLGGQLKDTAQTVDQNEGDIDYL